MLMCCETLLFVTQHLYPAIQCPSIHLLLYTITNWMMICIICVLRLRVDVTYMNYRANCKYSLSEVKKLVYWCNWSCVEYYKKFMCCGMMVFQGYHMLILFWSSISFWPGKLFYSFRFIFFWFWLPRCNFLVLSSPLPLWF